MTLSSRMFDARLPPEIARLAEDGGVAHTQIDTVTLAVLAVLGGAYVALGANFSTVALSGTPDLVPYGWMRVVGGLVFSLAGRIPARGELVRHPSGIEFEVLDADPRRIKKLRIHKAQDRKETPTETPAPESS